MKNIKVSKKIWQRLRKLRDKQGFVHFNSTVEFLLDQYESKSLPVEKTTVIQHSISDKKRRLLDIESAIDDVLRRRQEK